MICEQENLYKQLETLFKEYSCAHSLDAMRFKAWERFQKLGLPTAGRPGPYRHLPLRHLYQHTFQKKSLDTSLSNPSSKELLYPHLLPESSHSYVVLVDGKFAPELSDLSALPKQVSILPLPQAFATFDLFLRNRQQHCLKEEKDPFAALNGALYQEGLFIYLPPKSKIDPPLQIIHLITHTENVVMPRLHLFAGSQSHLTLAHGVISFQDGILSSKEQTKEQLWINMFNDFALEEGSHLTRLSLHENLRQGFLFDSLRATLKRDSSLRTVTAHNGAATIHQDAHIQLLEENSTAHLAGGWIAGSSCHAHTHVRIEHFAPHCRSRQLFKGILLDTARSSFEGEIYIHPEAQQSDAFQLNNHLLLSDRAIAYSQPKLQIFADDVKASHGATAGQLHPEELFYLTSRGLPLEEAKRLLTAAFLANVFEEVTISSLQAKMQLMGQQIPR
jgi:Fe-S cluster assembly protein SufD